MNRTKKLIVFISFLIFLFALEDIFLNVTVNFDSRNVIKEQIESMSEPESEDISKPATVEVQKGIVFKIFFLNSLIQEVNDDYTPSDGKLENTIAKIDSLLIGQKIKLFLNLFIILLCFSTVVSSLSEAWFSVFMQRVLLVIAFATFSYYLSRSIFLAYHLPFIGFPMLIFHFPVYVVVCMSIIHTYNKFFNAFFSKKYLSLTACILFFLGFSIGFYFLDNKKTDAPFVAIQYMLIGATTTIYGFIYILFLWLMFRLNRFFKLSEVSSDYKFNSLLLASFNDEENNARPTIKAASGEIKKESSFLRIAGHFLLIIFSGVFVGNVIYIPLFSLQKHYTSQFGILLIVMLLLLCIFYVRNYYKIGREEGLSVTKNILVSLSFLQYRFLKNFFFIILSTVGVLVFITCLFLLLTMDTVILKNYNIIDKTINL